LRVIILQKQKGFTLIELVVVIVILGILAVTAAPKFINLTDDADEAVFLSTAGAFSAGVQQVHVAWLIRGNGRAVQDFIPIADPAVGGDLSVNANGFPADTRGSSLTLNSEADCLDVWRAVLDSQDLAAEGDGSGDVEATYNGNNDCTYTLNSQTNLTITYNSITGEVVY